MSVYDDIQRERECQDAKWGGSAHDDRHSPEDWYGFIHEHNRKAVNATLTGSDETYRRRMVEIGALAVAAVESYDRRTA